eukprot:1037278-Pleurochrysis_carterae.AAC.3
MPCSSRVCASTVASYDRSSCGNGSVALRTNASESRVAPTPSGVDAAFGDQPVEDELVAVQAGILQVEEISHHSGRQVVLQCLLALRVETIGDS